jgi:hypothetical protein
VSLLPLCPTTWLLPPSAHRSLPLPSFPPALANRACSSKQDREISAHIKRACDEKYGPTWQCIVGEDFKASFTHETKHFMFVASGKQNVVRGQGQRGVGWGLRLLGAQLLGG